MYKNINPERIIRAIKFDNKKGARSFIKDKENYLEKNSTYDVECPLNVNVDKILTNLIEEKDTIDSIEDIDLNTEICGVKLENPFLLSSSIVGSRYEMCKRAFELGWAGVATKTISMMPIHESSPRFSVIKDCDGDFLGFKNIEQLSEYSIDENIEMIRMLKLVPKPQVNGKSSLGGYSGKAVKPIALRFISEMSNCKELGDLCYSGMGGIYTWRDAVEFMLLGCTNIQVTTAIMEYGYRIIDDLLSGLKIFMKEKNYKRVSDFVGLSKCNVINNDELEKETIEFPMINYEKCIGCGRCYISCKDGGHEAITFNENRKPTINGSKCAGCQLCKLVCPQSAISRSSKRLSINYKK